MIKDVVIVPMSRDFVVWRCLHGGPLSREDLEACPSDLSVDWPTRRAKNVPLLEKLIDTYGTCAMLARDGDVIVGLVRFYPKWLFEWTGAGLCMQQCYPAGPNAELVDVPFPPLAELADKALSVHCMTTGSPLQASNPYQRKGLASQMVEVLIDWAGEHGWIGIAATACEEAEILYANSGAASMAFWEKLGFRLVETGVEPALREDNDFTRQLRAELAARGADPARAANRYLMRRELA